MQIFHLALTVVSIILFCLYSLFTYQQKSLFSFGFFPFYEYLLISRNYAFSMLFFFAFCKIFPSRKITYIYLATLFFCAMIALFIVISTLIKLKDNCHLSLVICTNGILTSIYPRLFMKTRRMCYRREYDTYHKNFGALRLTPNTSYVNLNFFRNQIGCL